jgi:CRP-like cAMP-binding protein
MASSLGLRRIALLEGVSSGRLDALARQCAWRRFEAGERILSREAPDRDVYLVVSGRVRVTIYSAAGRQVTFRDIPAGELFGEVAAIDGLPRSADVVALESGLAACMPFAVFRELLRDEPAVVERVLHRLASLVRRMSGRVIDLSTLNVPSRIHAELLRLAREAGIRANAARIEHAPTHADLASQVSTYREEVSRELSSLARAGIVQRDGRALLIRDVKRLEALLEEVSRSA